MPQAALRLETSLPIFSNEMLLKVDCLNLDSASFRQLRESSENRAARVAEQVREIVAVRGKMQNPVTGSGGMLIGKIAQRGPEFPGEGSLGTSVATLVSLTLTPLHLEKILEVDMQRGQIWVEGYGVLFASSLFTAMPEDFSQAAALEILDVCGAPAQLQRWAKPGDRVLVLGLGRAGLLTGAWLKQWGRAREVWGCDVSELGVLRAQSMNFFHQVFCADAREPQSFFQNLIRRKIDTFDLVLNTCNGPDTEAAALLAVAPQGRALYFNMATDFARVVLGAEGLGKAAHLVMGQGYLPGHVEVALNLVREFPQLRAFFSVEKSPSRSEA